MPTLEQIRGMFIPVPTPFTHEGELDEVLFAEMVRHYLAEGAHALFLFGSYGQGPAMSVAQRMKGLEIAMEASSHQVPVVPQVGAVDPFTARELALHAKATGVIAIGLVGPYYYADRTEQELMQFFRFVADAVDLPIFLYNNPQYQGYAIAPALLARLRAAVPSVFGVKLAKGNIGDILAYRNALGDGFRLFAPQENLFPGLLVGQSGTVSPPLTLAPRAGVALVRAVDEGRYDEALQWQLKILQFHTALLTLQRYGRAVQAEGLRHLGFPVQCYPRWPAEVLPEEAKRTLYAAIDAVNEPAVV